MAEQTPSRRPSQGIVRRVIVAWGRLGRDQRLAALAAVGLLVTMFLPWYEKNAFDRKAGRFVNDSVSAFGALSFVEAAIFLVSAGVLLLLFARAEGRHFHLPGGDGTVIFAAGVWAAVLLFYRVFDRPDVNGDSGTVGVQWGFFVAFIAAGALALAGSRVRAAHRPEPVPGDPGNGRPARPVSDHEAETHPIVPPRRRAPRTAQPAEVPLPADPPAYVPPEHERPERPLDPVPDEEPSPPESPPPDRLF